MLVFFAKWGMALLGWAMVATSLLTKFDGLPKQIWANFKAKTAPRVLRRFIIWGGLAYALQTVHCALNGDWMTALAQGPGAVLMAILIVQMRLYPPSKEPPVESLAVEGMITDVNFRPVSKRQGDGRQVGALEVDFGGMASMRIGVDGNGNAPRVSVDGGVVTIDSNGVEDYGVFCYVNGIGPIDKEDRLGLRMATPLPRKALHTVVALTLACSPILARDHPWP